MGMINQVSLVKFELIEWSLTRLEEGIDMMIMMFMACLRWARMIGHYPHLYVLKKTKLVIILMIEMNN